MGDKGKKGRHRNKLNDTYEHHRHPLEMLPCQISSKRVFNQYCGRKKGRVKAKLQSVTFAMVG
jgi:hypothetical protein